MRILKVSQTYYPYLNEGGRPVKVKALAEHLARRGHEVVVVTADLGNQEPGARSQKPEAGSQKSEVRSQKPEARSQKSRVISQKPRAMSHEPCSGSPVEIHYLRTLARHRALTLNPGIVPFCLRHLRQFDVVHIYGLYDLLGPVVAWFCRRWGIPYVVEPMGMYRPIVRSLRKKRLYHRFLGRAMIEGAARVIATSEQEWQELVAEGLPPDQVVMRRNGIDLAQFTDLPPRGYFRRALGLPEDIPLVLFLGRVSRVKGLVPLLLAFADIRYPAHLAIVGPDDRDGCLEEVQHLVQTLGLKKRVSLVGPRYGREKLEALVDADIFVLPSYYESFGNAAAEAIACGTPVIVSDQCGIAPWVKERVGMVVEFGRRTMDDRRWTMGALRREGAEGHGSSGARESGRRSSFVRRLHAEDRMRVQALRGALERLLSDGELRARFRANCPQVARELSWDEAVAEQERIYVEVRSQEPGARIQKVREN